MCVAECVASLEADGLVMSLSFEGAFSGRLRLQSHLHRPSTSPADGRSLSSVLGILFSGLCRVPSPFTLRTAPLRYVSIAPNASYGELERQLHSATVRFDQGVHADMAFVCVCTPPLYPSP